MDDTGPAPVSPIIRSSWKPNPAATQPSTVLPVIASPTSSFLSTNTVSPLTGFRESATVTDVTWATAFQTPTKSEASKVDPGNSSVDVFMTCAEQSVCFAQHSDTDISLKDDSRHSSRENNSTSVIEENPPETSPAKPKELTASEVLSTFRNNTLQRVYPKPPSPKDVTKDAAFYSTPKADRPLLKMPQPPASAILPSKYQGSTMRLRICPCGTCSCPAVYLKDAGVQTDETSGDEEQAAGDYHMGGLTQLVAQEIGRYDGFTQQSIMQETAKANRVRPKSVVHFRESLGNRGGDGEKPLSKSFTSSKKALFGTDPSEKPFDSRKFFGDDFVDPNDSFQGNPGASANDSTSNGFASFKKAGSGKTVVSNKPFNARKFFGDDFADLDEGLPQNLETSSSALPSNGFASFKKASGGVIPKSSFDAKKLFGEDLMDLKIPQEDFEREQLIKPLPSHKMPQKSSLKKATSNGKDALFDANGGAHLNSSVTVTSEHAKKLFGDDLPIDLPQSRLGGFKSARKVQMPSDNDSNAATSLCQQSDNALAKVRSVFGEDELNAIMAELPRSSGYVGFQSSRKLVNNSLDGSSESKTGLVNETNFISSSAVPEMSDVESVYDEDIDSNTEVQNVDDEPEMEEDTMSIPPEMFFQASDQVCNLADSETIKARAEQRRIISEKSLASTLPKMRSHGIMWRTRLFASEQSLRSVSKFLPNFSDCAHVDAAILKVVLDPYSDYRFPAQFSNGSLMLQWHTLDGGLLVGASDGTVGCEELKTCLLTTPGVDPSLIPSGWFENHYRWIVWKLAREVFTFRSEFPDQYSRLNAECTMQQLKYRYDREIDSCQRPCLRRIVEKDSSAKGMMVLCVSKIVLQGQQSPDQCNVGSVEDDQHSKESTGSTAVHHSSVQLELTDGWYSLPAQLDAPLQRMVMAGRIFVGCKLVTAGAELNGLEEGVDPLQIPSTCHLRICANSTRLVRRWWSARLGFAGGKKLCVPIRSLFPGGGNANAIKAVAGRVYPFLFVEKRISPGGTVDSIYRLEVDEAAEAERAKAAQEREAEEMMSKMSADCQSPRPGAKRRKITSAELKELCTGEEIAAALRESFDPESVQQMMSEAQREAYYQYLTSKKDKMIREVQSALQKAREEQPNRNVTPVLKVFVIGMSQFDRQTDTTAVLSIWHAPANARDLLQEGRTYSFYNVSVSRPPSSFNSALLNGIRITSWQPLSANSDDVFIERDGISLRDIPTILGNPKVANYTNREIDLVGIVLRPLTEQTGSKRLFFVDYEGDIGILQGTAVSFNAFLSGECSRQTVPGTFVATNLRLNSSTPTSAANQGMSAAAIPTLFAQDYSTFTYLPPSTTAIPPRIASVCRHLEASIKTALVNRASLAESGLRKLETTKLFSLPDEASRSVSRTDFRNSLLPAETGPQRPGSAIAKTPASTKQQLTGHELQKRKMEKLDRICSAADSSFLTIPSPLPAESTSARSRSVLKRAFRTPFKTNTDEDATKK